MFLPHRASGEARDMVEHYKGTVVQPRANPKQMPDGSVLLTRDVPVTLTRLVPQRTLINNALVVAVAFFSHNYIAHHQALMFDKCVDELKPNSIAVLIDFSMNYSHNHPDAEQSEWWSSHQSTFLPVIVYSRSKEGRLVWAR